MSDGFVHTVKRREEPLPGVCSGSAGWRGDARQIQVEQRFLCAPTDRVDKWDGFGRGQPCKDFPDYPTLPEMSERDRCWSLAFIGRRASNHNPDIEEEAKTVKEMTTYVDRPHIPRQAASEEEKGNLENDGETPDEKRNGHFSMPSNLCCRSPRRSTIDLPLA